MLSFMKYYEVIPPEAVPQGVQALGVGASAGQDFGLAIRKSLATVAD